MANTSQLRTAVLTTSEEIEKVRQSWAAVQKSPEADIDFVSFIVGIRPEILRPHVIVVYQGDEPISLLVGRVEDSHFEIKVGYKVVWRRKIRRIINFYGGFIGQTEPEITELVVRRLLAALREQKAVACVWDGVPWNSDLLRILKSAPNLLCRDYLARPGKHWTMSLPDSLDELLEQRLNKKHRYWAKRTMRMLEKDFPGAVRYTSFSKPEEVPNLFRDAVAVAKKTYQWGLGVGFRDSEEQKKRLELEARQGWLRAYILYLNNEPVAFWICTLYSDTIHLDCTGFDPALRKYEVGTALLLQVIAGMCAQKIKKLDFGTGTSVYKEKFGDFQFDETTMLTFRFSPQGIFLNGLRHFTQGPIESLRSVVKTLGLEQKLKKFWRTRAAHRPEAASAVEAEN
jgi:hypothetical protein